MDLKELDSMAMDSKRKAPKPRPMFATVKAVNADKVALLVDGDNVVYDIQYQCLYKAQVGDRVYLNYVNGEAIVVGTVSPSKAPGVSKEYVDNGDIETRRVSKEYTDNKNIETTRVSKEYTDSKNVEATRASKEYTDSKNVETTSNVEANYVNYTNGGSLGWSDGRDTNLIPNWYVINNKKGLTLQLVDGNAIGIPTNLVHLITIFPWRDITGGISQVAISFTDNKLFVRHAVDFDTWSSFNEK